MNAAEILNDLPKLSPGDRSHVFARLAELHEADLLSGAEASPGEREALDAALKDYERDGDPGRPWREVLQQMSQG
jgi:hypothetical protein